MTASGSSPAALGPVLAALVVKEQVRLGGLPPALLDLALGVVWAGLPADGPLSEAAVNAALRAQLAGSAAFLATDHVELRRWLVDAGWLARDGFGREYRRVPAAALPPGRQPVGAALGGVDVAAWCAAERARRAAARQRRREAWQARQAAAPPDTPPDAPASR